jgi:hypothetical protein
LVILPVTVTVLPPAILFGKLVAVIAGAASAMNGGSLVAPRKVLSWAWKLWEVMKFRKSCAAVELICTFGLPANLPGLIA